MRIASNTLGQTNCIQAAQSIPGIIIEMGKDFTPRSASFAIGKHVYIFSTRTKGPASRRRPEYRAASWTEHGQFIEALYQLEPEAEIAGYKSQDDFHNKTAAIVEHERRRGIELPAPWLA